MKKAIEEPIMTMNEIRAKCGLDPVQDVKHVELFSADQVEKKVEKDRLTNCPNCCAVITGPICEYCGTRFPWIQDAITIPIEINGKMIDEVVKGMRNPARYVAAPELPIQEQR